MNLPLDFRRGYESFPTVLEAMVARINAIWRKEHKDDGSHGAITADSIAINGGGGLATQGGALIGGALRADGPTSELPTYLPNSIETSIDLGRAASGRETIWARTSPTDPAATSDVETIDLDIRAKATTLQRNAGTVTINPVTGGGSVLLQPALTSTLALDCRGGADVYGTSRMRGAVTADAAMTVGGTLGVTAKGTFSGQVELTSTAAHPNGGLIVNNFGQFKGNLISDAPGSFYANNNAFLTTGLYEYNRSGKQGDWVPVAFNAGNFGALGGSWALVAGNVASNFYTIVGHTMFYTFQETGGVIGAGSTELRMFLPAGFTAAANAGNLTYATDGAGYLPVLVEIRSGLNYFIVRRVSALGGAFTAGAGSLFFQLAFPI